MLASFLKKCYAVNISLMYSHHMLIQKKEATMLPGVYSATKKDGTLYYRASVNFKNKHISLGSFSSETDASEAYQEALRILSDTSVTVDTLFSDCSRLSHDKAVVLLNFRCNGLYCKNPIYLRKGYFSYFLSPTLELKFDIDDLFYYSSHKIQKRNGHLFVNDYGMQYSILARYGIKPYAVSGRDYQFANGDDTDYRYSNIIIINRYHGVFEVTKHNIKKYKVLIHINGNYKIGTYSSEEKAAIAYNKAADLAKAAGIAKKFPENYVDSYSPKKYAEVYTNLHISKRYLDYLSVISG